jgi:hypothetical protein
VEQLAEITSYGQLKIEFTRPLQVNKKRLEEHYMRKSENKDSQRRMLNSIELNGEELNDDEKYSLNDEQLEMMKDEIEIQFTCNQKKEDLCGSYRGFKLQEFNKEHVLVQIELDHSERISKDTEAEEDKLLVIIKGDFLEDSTTNQ